MLARALALRRPTLALARHARGAAAAASAPHDAPPRAHHLILSVAGKDRVGIVGDFASTALAHEANVEETRMARLGGEFCIMGLVSLPSTTPAATVATAFEAKFPGFAVTCRATESEEVYESAAEKGRQSWALELEGPDQIGIVNFITEELAKTGSNISAMETETSSAPFAGYPLFKLRTLFSVKPREEENVLKAMTRAEDKFGVTISMAREDSVDSSSTA